MRILTLVPLLLSVLLGTTPAPTAAGELELGTMVIDPLTAEDGAALVASGLESARIVISWDQVQREPDGPLDFAQSDREIAALAAAGIRPLPVLFGSGPHRIAEDPVTPPVTREARRDWKAYVRGAVERYRADSDFWPASGLDGSSAPVAWEVWNEQNSLAFWPPEPNPRAYARLLHATAAQIRRADPSALVVVGGLFGRPRHPRSIPAPAFLEAMYAIPGSRPDFDEVGAHPYAVGVPRLQEQLEELRAAIDRAGDRATAIRVTEFGWGSRPTSHPNWTGFTRDPDGQAKLLGRSVRLMIRRSGDLGLSAAHWFAWRDPVRQEICPFCSSVGLLERDHSPKPAFYAIQRLAAD